MSSSSCKAITPKTATPLSESFSQQLQVVCEQSACHEEIALVLQPRFDRNGAFSETFPAQEFQQLSGIYKIYFALVGSIDEMRDSIQSTSREGSIKVVWIRAHGSSRYMALGNGKETSDEYFDAYKAFSEPRYDGLFNGIHKQASIILYSCSVGEISEIDMEMGKNRDGWNRILAGGHDYEYEEGCYPLRLSGMVDYLKVQKGEQKVRVSALNVATACAFLATGHQVHATVGMVITEKHGLAFDRFSYSLGVRGFNMKTFTIFDAPVQDIVQKTQGIAFTIPLNSRSATTRRRNIGLVFLERKAYQDRSDPDKQKQVLAYLRERKKIIWRFPEDGALCRFDKNQDRFCHGFVCDEDS